MRLSIVIPTYNRRELLRDTLPAIFNQDFRLIRQVCVSYHT